MEERRDFGAEGTEKAQEGMSRREVVHYNCSIPCASGLTMSNRSVASYHVETQYSSVVVNRVHTDPSIQIRSHHIP